jgi:hypothetical protein
MTAENTFIEFAAGAYARSEQIINANGARCSYIKTKKRRKPKTQHKGTPEIPIPERNGFELRYRLGPHVEDSTSELRCHCLAVEDTVHEPVCEKST